MTSVSEAQNAASSVMEAVQGTHSATRGLLGHHTGTPCWPLLLADWALGSSQTSHGEPFS